MTHKTGPGCAIHPGPAPTVPTEHPKENHMTFARDLTPGDTFVEDGHQFTVTAIEPAGTGLRIRSTLPGGAPHTHFLAPDTEMDTR